MERKVFLKHEGDKVIVCIKHLTSGDLEPLATYNIATQEMTLHDIPRYFYVLRHIESLHLILGYLEGKGFINPVGDREPLTMKALSGSPQAVKSSTREVDWLVDEESLKTILTRTTLSKNYYEEFKEQLPKVGDKYLIAKTNVKDRASLENANPLTLMSPSLKQSLVAVLGEDAVNLSANEWLHLGFDLQANDDFILFNLQNTANFTEFKKEVSALRRGGK